MGWPGMVIASAYDMNPIVVVSYHKWKTQFRINVDIQEEKSCLPIKGVLY